jgi:hypothetical protein
MLSDTAVPEKEVQTSDPDELRNLLETDYKTTYYPTTLDHICFLPSGEIQFDGHQMPYAPGFLDAAANAIGMPLGYAYDLDLDLFRANFEQRKHPRSKAVTICRNRGIAVNFCDAEYRPARTIDVLRGLVDGNSWTMNIALLSDRGVEINYIQPGFAVVPAPNDVIELGIRISNSETGYTGLKASRSSLRLVCTNGAVMTDHLGTARWNYDKRVAYDTSISHFQKDVFKLGERQGAQVQLYERVLQRNLLDREFVNLWRRLRTSSITVPEVDRMLGLSPDERQAIQVAVRERPAGLPAVPTDLSTWDILNRITSAAQRMDFVRRARLERIGGGLLAEVSSN